ncbi:hypothetical protein K7C20_21800 [Streptomyces decoyicus]|nr:hypothetical protein K7C20_21800 [Streptomyces decoyicus]
MARPAACFPFVNPHGVPEAGTVACACCFPRTLGHRSGWEICEVCGWEDDGQDDRNAGVVIGGPNAVGLAEARVRFRARGACDERCSSYEGDVADIVGDIDHRARARVSASLRSRRSRETPPRPRGPRVPLGLGGPGFLPGGAPARELVLWSQHQPRHHPFGECGDRIRLQSALRAQLQNPQAYRLQLVRGQGRHDRGGRGPARDPAQQCPRPGGRAGDGGADDFPCRLVQHEPHHRGDQSGDLVQAEPERLARAAAARQAGYHVVVVGPQQPFEQHHFVRCGGGHDIADDVPNQYTGVIVRMPAGRLRQRAHLSPLSERTVTYGW